MVVYGQILQNHFILILLCFVVSVKRTARLHFAYCLLETDNDALYVIHDLFLDLLLVLYYSIDIVL